MLNVTEIQLSDEELKLLLYIVEIYKDRTADITEDGILVFSDDIVQKTGLSYYQQMSLKRKLEVKGLLKLKFRDIPRKLYYKLPVGLVKEYLTARGFSGYVDHAVFNS